jgi:hypothetical protein
MVDAVYLDNYRYTGLTGFTYIPYVRDGKWYVIPHRECTFLEFVYLCKVPDEDATVLKLTHGRQ